LGGLGLVLQPLVFLEIRSVIGSAFGGHSTAGVGYLLFVFAGLSPSRRL
jgi:hypothetical protein